MATKLVKVVTIPAAPSPTLVSTNPDGSQVWREYTWDAGAEAWKGVLKTRPGPPRPTVPTKPPLPITPPPPVPPRAPITVPDPTVRDPFGLMPDGSTAADVEAARRAYQARFAAWRAANPEASIWDFFDKEQTWHGHQARGQ